MHAQTLEPSTTKTPPLSTSAFEDNFLALLAEAAAANASDLHLDPLEDGIRVRIRVDGELRVLQWIRGGAYAERFTQQAKRACGFDMGRLGVPQDRRLRAKGIPFDLRASLVPSLYGEKIVLRLLQRGKVFSLTRYAMPEGAKADLRRALGQWQGLILITGPTGSGKTTLLYAALSEIDLEKNNVHTLEDPVEYALPGVIQSSIGGGELSFAEALRALMRQDPDVIMVGEIRDEATAQAAVHAAGTGHLVLSTVHATSALEAINRLEDLGLSRAQVTTNLLFVSAQRLVPRNCPECLIPDHDAMALAAKTFGEPLVPMVSRGCPACQGTGVAGRILLFEHVTPTGVVQGGQGRLARHGSLRDQALAFLKEGVIHAQHACAFA